MICVNCRTTSAPSSAHADDPPPSAPASGWRSLSCGQRKTLIRFREFRPSTDIHRLAHRVRENSAQTRRFGRLPNNGFRGNVNRPRDTAARKSGETRRSSGPVRLSDPGFQASSEDAETPKQGPGSRSSSASAPGSRRTRPGSTDGARFALRNAEDQGPMERQSNDAGSARRR